MTLDRWSVTTSIPVEHTDDGLPYVGIVWARPSDVDRLYNLTDYSVQGNDGRTVLLTSRS